MKIFNKIKKNKGFVILYAVMISSMLLAIALGVANISLKEIKFGASAKDANDAFFAADVGIECALYYDRTDPSNNAFTGGDDAPGMSCAGSSVTLDNPNPSVWTFKVLGLGSGGRGCANVTVDKHVDSLTTITSKGYNNKGSLSENCIPDSNSVERLLEAKY